jgi:hypothetical protein
MKTLNDAFNELLRNASDIQWLNVHILMWASGKVVAFL